MTGGFIGIANTGSGTVRNEGVQAIGPGAQATGSAAAQAAAATDHGAGPDPADIERNVFVVHGRDTEVRLRFFDFLRSLDLKPFEWENLVAATGQATPFVGDVVQSAPALTRAALVLLTPDDVVRLHPALHGAGDRVRAAEPSCQPRPNVLFELGLVITAYAARTVIVELGTLRPFSDLAGRNTIRFDGSPGAIGKVVERLKVAGCRVDDRGADWRDPRRFARLDAYTRGPR